MLQRLRALFAEREAAGGAGLRRHKQDELQLAVATLLVEAAQMDGEFSDAERTTLTRLIEDRFQLGDGAELLAAAETVAEESGEYWSYARVVKNSFEYDERLAIIEMLWEVAYADGVLHDYEASLLRRITGLLYVSDRDSGAARKRVMSRLGLSGD